MKPGTIQERFRELHVWRRKGERAPHKPLLLLFAFGRLTQGAPRLIPYREIDHALHGLLTEFGPPRSSRHTEYPFWRLQNDGVWEVEDRDRFAVRESSTDAKRSELLKHDARGGFEPEIFDALRRSDRLVRQISLDLLDAHFPASMHEDIREAVGLEVGSRMQRRPLRDPTFRERVLGAYQYACAVCRSSVRLGDRTIGLEAAHIKWHQAGGPDLEVNGLALCSLHHKLFDLGAFTVAENHSAVISQSAHGNPG